jgi:hypothetical protein
VDVTVGRYPFQVGSTSHVTHGPVSLTVESEVERGGRSGAGVQGPVGAGAAECPWGGLKTTISPLENTFSIQY